MVNFGVSMLFQQKKRITLFKLFRIESNSYCDAATQLNHPKMMLSLRRVILENPPVTDDLDSTFKIIQLDGHKLSGFFPFSAENHLRSREQKNEKPSH